MNPKKILAVDDNKAVRELIAQILSSNGYEVKTAENGHVALEMVEAEFFPVVFVDLMMPVMDGSVLIDGLNAMTKKPVIVVITSRDKPDTIVSVMKQGVFDYIVKPVSGNALLFVTDRAWEHSELIAAQALIEKEKMIRMEQQLEWYKWADRTKNVRTGIETHQSLLNNLRTCFSQGAGFGSLLSLLNMVIDTAEKVDEQYRIDATIFSLIRENVDMANKAIKILGDIDEIMINPMETEVLSVAELHHLIAAVRDRVASFAQKRKHTVVVSENKTSFDLHRIRINREHFGGVIQELLMNAFKFSPPNTTIKVMMNVEGDRVTIYVMNSPVKNKLGVHGIPQEYANIIFEPFVRLTEYLQEEYKTMDFGLGLNLVEQVVKKHGGAISIGNVTDYSRSDMRMDTNVSCRIKMPLLEGKQR